MGLSIMKIATCTMQQRLHEYRLSSNSGAVLITVLVVVFIVMAIITNITVKNYRVIRRLNNQNIKQQANSILLAGINFGRAGLATSGATAKFDSLTDIWAQPLPKTKFLDDILLSGYISDEQGKFNINDLVTNGNVNPLVLQQFTQLLSALNIPSGMASNIALYMASPQNQSNIMSQYTTGAPAYRPAGRPLIDLSELMLVKGMQASWVFKLSRHVSVIPQFIDYSGLNLSESGTTQKPPAIRLGTQAPTSGMNVNVNTASPEVISAKSGIPLPVAQRIAAQRNNVPFKTTQDVTNFLTQNGIMMSQNSSGGGNNTQKVDTGTLTTESKYFTIHAIVNNGDYEFRWVALVNRASRDGQWPRVLWQHPE
jgi:general secretion pathway protein K